MNRWWHYGLLGGFTVLFIVALRAITYVVLELLGLDLLGKATWIEVVAFAVAIFGMGFTLGVVIWAGRGLSKRLGRAVGSAISWSVAMVVYFICGMLVFEPKLLGTAFMSDGIQLLGFAAVIGLIGGCCFPFDYDG
jgi:hypothetical protein